MHPYSVRFRPSPNTSPDGGIGRRAGLKHQWSNPCRFDPGSGYPTKCKCLKIKHLHFSFSHLHHACTTKSAISGQNQYFSKKFSVGPVSFVCLGAKLVKVGANGSLHRVLSLLFSSCPYLCGFLSCLHHKNIHKFSNNCTIGLTWPSEGVFAS